MIFVCLIFSVCNLTVSVGKATIRVVNYLAYGFKLAKKYNRISFPLPVNTKKVSHYYTAILNYDAVFTFILIYIFHGTAPAASVNP